MNLAELSIKRPIFITCLVVLMVVLGIMSYNRMPVDQFPDVTFPVVFAEIQYPGASPVDVERQISKVIRSRPVRWQMSAREHPANTMILSVATTATLVFNRSILASAAEVSFGGTSSRRLSARHLRYCHTSVSTSAVRRKQLGKPSTR